MKTTTLSIIAILLASFTAYCSDGKFHAGLQGGYFLVGMTNPPITDTKVDFLTKQTDNPYTKFKPKFGGAFGLVLGYDFGKSLGLQIEMNMAGAGHAGSTTSGLESRDINMTYFQLPVLFKIMGNGKTSRFYTEIGPQFNFLMNANMVKHTSSSDIELGDVKDHFNGTDIGIALGLGSDIYVIEEDLYINFGLKLYYGLTDVNATAYQLPSKQLITYAPSNNFFGGLNLGAHYRF